MTDGGIQELKDGFDGFNRDFEAFKALNDRRFAEIAKSGAADPLTVEALGKLNASLDATEKRIDGIEVSLRRAPKDDSPETRRASWSDEHKAFDRYCRTGEVDTKALSLGDDTQAGYLAPNEFSREIIKAEVEFSPLRALARVRTTSNRSLEIPKRTGTFSAQWTAEQGTRSETEGLTYGLEEIPTHEMYALVDITGQMLEDSEFDLEAELNSEFSEQFGVAEGTAFVTGDATGKPEGFLDNTSVSSTNSGSATTIADSSGQGDGIVDLWHGIKTAYATRGVWTLNRSTLGEVRKLKTSTTNQYIWQPGLAPGSPNTILGSPYTEVPDMPDQGANTFPMAFGAWQRAYTILDRVQMQVLRDPYTQATTGKVRFIARKRVGGQVVLSEAIRLLKCAA